MNSSKRRIYIFVIIVTSLVCNSCSDSVDFSILQECNIVGSWKAYTGYFLNGLYQPVANFEHGVLDENLLHHLEIIAASKNFELEPNTELEKEPIFIFDFKRNGEWSTNQVHHSNYEVINNCSEFKELNLFGELIRCVPIYFYGEDVFSFDYFGHGGRLYVRE